MDCIKKCWVKKAVFSLESNSYPVAEMLHYCWMELHRVQTVAVAKATFLLHFLQRSKWLSAILFTISYDKTHITMIILQKEK